MEDYIFIIIAIVLSALGALNRNKKKRIAQMEENGNGKNEPSFFEQQFVDTFFEDEIPEPVVETPKPAPRVVVEPKPVQIIKEEKKPKVLKETKTDNEETRLDSIRNNFSLKKAVIYSEILNRKY